MCDVYCSAVFLEKERCWEVEKRKGEERANLKYINAFSSWKYFCTKNLQENNNERSKTNSALCSMNVTYSYLFINSPHFRLCWIKFMVIVLINKMKKKIPILSACLILILNTEEGGFLERASKDSHGLIEHGN